MLSRLGPIGRLGRYTATHFRLVAIVWSVVAVALGVFAPKVEHALSGAGWEATGSESVEVRQLVDRDFGGLSSSALQVVVHSRDQTARDPAFETAIAAAQRILKDDGRVAQVVPPRPGTSIARDGHTAIVQAGAAGDPNDLVRAADDLKGELTALGGQGLDVNLTGASGMWSDFNEANKTAMMKSELISWPVTLGILVLAFGSLVAAGLPLLLTILGLVAAAGSLYLGTQLLDISIWAMNFALMFALALGIDYALFIVMRFRGAFSGTELSAGEAVGETMDPGEHRSPLFAGWAERLWRRPLPYGVAAVAALVGLSMPVLGLDTGMPSIKVVPEEDASRQGYTQVQAAFGPGAPGVLQIVGPRAAVAEKAAGVGHDRGIDRVMPPQPGRSGMALVQAIPNTGPSTQAVGETVDRLRERLPQNLRVGGAVAENHDLEVALAAKTPLVIGVVLALGFLLLLVALQAPIIAVAGALTNLLATGAAFGVAQLIFQRGHLSGLLGFEPQGFLDAWGPVFFFAMIFAISMDYTVFLLSSAKEHWDRGEGAKGAMVGAMAHSGRVIFAAAGVMVAVFFTFALSGPLPPKEMGVILGVAVLLDAALVRLLLMPVVLRLLGDKAWWLPKALDRVLPDVRFGHA